MSEEAAIKAATESLHVLSAMTGAIRQRVLVARITFAQLRDCRLTEEESVAVLEGLRGVPTMSGTGGRRETEKETVMPVEQIAWLCDACEKPIADGDGYLHVDEMGVLRYEDGWREWRRRHGVPDDKPMALTLDVIREGPDPMPWGVHHEGCDPTPGPHSYQISVERARTAHQLLDWTLHLEPKGFLSSTTWRDLMERVAGPFDA